MFSCNISAKNETEGSNFNLIATEKTAFIYIVSSNVL